MDIEKISPHWEQLNLDPLLNTMSSDTMYGAIPPSISISPQMPTLTISDLTTTSNITWANSTIGLPAYTISGNTSVSQPMWTTGTSGTLGINGISAVDIKPSATITLKGEDADIDINGKSLMKTLEALEDRLNMLVPNPELEKEWDQLKKLGDRYRKLEKQCRDKATMWAKLKKMPKIDIT